MQTNDRFSCAPLTRPRLVRRDANRPFPSVRRFPSSPNTLRASVSAEVRGEGAQFDTDSETPTTPMSPRASRSSVVVEAHQSILSHNLGVIHSFKKKPFLLYAENVLRGFMRRNESECGRMVPGIVDIVSAYYVDEEAGIFQLGHRLHRVLKKTPRRTMSLPTARALTERHFEQKGRGMVSVKVVDINFVCNELVRLGYLVPIRGRCDGISGSNKYQFPMQKVLEFTCPIAKQHDI